ncbi:GIY-YIG nuclease family protein [bacterium]|jgi:predicted GIY-YIG superfamily endonuclease|nr:GIY-YIG nuclease family protein [bacterium]MBT6831509.1 GIY-YIG nuclease family protein [bacterium]MBT6996159.1 GIY-YIG nuclease family protein [bacterium]MBT7772542.1 GIY-YIG nuclease family protein [bacterium]
MKYYFYLARCSDESFYAGYTKNIEEREKTHNAGKGAKYTASRRPVKIIYWEKFETQKEAMQREIEIKKWTRTKKEKLIQKK